MGQRPLPVADALGTSGLPIWLPLSGQVLKVGSLTEWPVCPRSPSALPHPGLCQQVTPPPPADPSPLALPSRQLQPMGI